MTNMNPGTSIDAQIESHLRNHELWANLTDAEFQKLAQSLRPEKLELGDTLREKSASEIDILAIGKMRLFKRSDTQEQTICTLDTIGECFSDSWLKNIDNVSARASEQSVVLRTEASILEELAQQNQSFAKALTQYRQNVEFLGFLRTHAPFDGIAPNKTKVLTRYLQGLLLTGGVNVTTKGLHIIKNGSIEFSDISGSQTLHAGDYFITDNFGPFKSTGHDFTVKESAEFIFLSADQYTAVVSHHSDVAEALSNFGQSPSATPKIIPSATPTASYRQASQPSAAEEVEESLPTKLSKLLHQYPVIMQQSQMDCGITCLAMVALFFGKRLDINDLRERAGVSVEGTNLLSLAETAEQFGFMTRGIRGTYEGLLTAKLPLICFWKQNHFVVLYEINKHEARIGDPAEGLLTISREEFTRDFSKSALELVPTVELKRAPGQKNPLTVLWPLAKPYKKQIRDVLLAGIVYQALMIITPFFSQTIIDRVIVHEDISMLNMLLIGMLLVTCFQSALTFARGVLLSTLSTKIDHALFVQFFKHLLSLPLKFFEQRTTGDVLARFNENARITAFLSGSTITVLLDSSMALIYLAVLFYYNWAFGLTTLAYVAVLAFLTFAYTPLLRGYSNELFKKTVANDSCVIETVHGVEKIKSAAAENRTRWKWEIIFVDKLSVSFRQQLAYNGYSVFTQLVHIAGRMLLMWLGAHLVIAKTFTVGQYMAVMMMSAFVIDPIMRVISMWQQLQGVNISLERIGDVFRSQPEQIGTKTRMPDVQGFIEFKNVTFRYNEQASKNVLLNVSYSVKPDQMIAIVGRSGCGKTTIARLIQGLYLPSSGAVLIDGVETTQMELSDLRKRTGVVAQQEYFFTGTVRENIAFYVPDAPLEKIIAASKMAGIHDKIQTMGSGYDTQLSEGGQNLSGGERQRMAIARALLHEPRILILDEATSALDSESEKHIQTCLETIRKGRTMIVIAHRLSTIKSADLILVVDQGQIVEGGKHDELLQKKGLYFQLCSQQSI
ncbi:MAG: peptidase domain-containing ABC transporter [Candidatus Obscuribacterales bacterium]|nr:peptidase domain-containing ABC transporter [Candidatus Obscuribacterales bacterium]